MPSAIPTTDAMPEGPTSCAVKIDRICVCICTYKRPASLRHLLRELSGQATDGLFTFSIVVADNDRLESAKAVASEFAEDSTIPLRYVVEPEQNIARARNKAVASADGDFLAFIDDDEFPVKDWLLLLYKTCQEHAVDGLPAPVKRHFDETPPQWLIRSRFYDRRVNPTGMVVHWHEARTGNVLLRSRILPAGEQPFRAEFRAGEDQDFFRRMIDKGHVFIWSADAVAYGEQPPACSRLADP